MNVTVFEKKIELDDKLVKEYETIANAPMDNDEAGYLAVSSGCNKHSTEKELESGIVTAMIDVIKIVPNAWENLAKWVSENHPEWIK